MPLLSVVILCTIVLGMSSRDKQREAATAGRPVDHQRRAELLDAVVDYTVEHGFSDLSWRPVAAALGVSTTTLVHRFGAKEQMLEAILGRLRERMLAATAAGRTRGEQPNLAKAARAAWTLTLSSATRRGVQAVLRGLWTCSSGTSAIQRLSGARRGRLDERPTRRPRTRH